MRGLKHQVKEKQKQNDGPASKDDTSDPGSLHLTTVRVRTNDVISGLSSPSQHTRVTVTGAEDVGELEYTCKDNTDCVADRGECRQPTQESGETFGHGEGVESGARDVPTVVLHFGVVREVTR